MRGILIDPGCEPVIRKLPDTQQGLQAMAGGILQIRKFGQVFAALLYVNQTDQALPCRHYIEKWYYGRLLICGWRNNHPTDLSTELARELAEKWKGSEVQE